MVIADEHSFKSLLAAESPQSLNCATKDTNADYDLERSTTALACHRPLAVALATHSGLEQLEANA